RRGDLLRAGGPLPLSASVSRSVGQSFGQLGWPDDAEALEDDLVGLGPRVAAGGAGALPVAAVPVAPGLEGAVSLALVAGEGLVDVLERREAQLDRPEHHA